MLIHPTVERLRTLGLSAMADAFIEMQNAPEAAELTREDWLGLLVDREATSRENKRLTRRLRDARLRQAAVVEDVNLHAPRGLDRALFQKPSARRGPLAAAPDHARTRPIVDYRRLGTGAVER